MIHQAFCIGGSCSYLLFLPHSYFPRSLLTWMNDFVTITTLITILYCHSTISFRPHACTVYNFQYCPALLYKMISFDLSISNSSHKFIIMFTTEVIVAAYSSSLFRTLFKKIYIGYWQGLPTRMDNSYSHLTMLKKEERG